MQPKPWYQSTTVAAALGIVLVSVLSQLDVIDVELMKTLLPYLGAGGLLGLRKATGGGLTK